MYPIQIQAGSKTISAQLNDSRTARTIWENLPILSWVQTWGDEIFFDTSLQIPLEEEYAEEVVQCFDMGYWPSGGAFCIFFGATPISAEGEIRPASAVTIIGRVEGTVEDFKQMMGETHIKVDRLSDT